MINFFYVQMNYIFFTFQTSMDVNGITQATPASFFTTLVINIGEILMEYSWKNL